MSQFWYDIASCHNDNWYKNKDYTDNMDIPKCISCDNFIVTSDSDLCSKCLSRIEDRNTSAVKEYIDSFSGDLISFEIDHIPEFSVITSIVKGESFLTIGVDWREVLITDVVEEDFSNEIIKDHIIEDSERSLVKFVLGLGDVMYPDTFDKDALRAMDEDFNKVIQKVFDENYGSKRNVVAWKAVDKKEIANWKNNGYIPKGEIFSLSKYFSFEKVSSIPKNKVLLKLFVPKNFVYMRRNNSIEIRKDLDIDNGTIEVL